MGITWLYHSEKWTVFWMWRPRKTVSLNDQRQISPGTYFKRRTLYTCIHYPSYIFQNVPDLLTTGEYHSHISHFTGCIWSTFSHILIHADQLHASEYTVIAMKRWFIIYKIYLINTQACIIHMFCSLLGRFKTRNNFSGLIRLIS